MRSLASSSGATNSSQVGAAASARATAARPSSSSAAMAGATCSGFSSAKRGSPEKSSSGFNTVLQQHGDGHRADAPGHRRDGAGDVPDRLEIDVADELAVGAPVDADVDHARSRFD